MLSNVPDTSHASNLTPAAPILYGGEPVVTLAQVDEFHERPTGTAKNAYRRHKGRLIEGEDFVEVSAIDFDRILAQAQQTSQGTSRVPSHNAGGRDRILLFESGYLLLTKPMKDDRAWAVQRHLVRTYFRAKAPAPSPQPAVLVAGEDQLRAIMADELARVLHSGQGKSFWGRLRSTVAEEIAKAVENMKPKRLIADRPTRQAHIEALAALRGGTCPCCCRYPAVLIASTSGPKLAAGAEVQVWRGSDTANVEHTWLVCGQCAPRLRNNNDWRFMRSSHFHAYQADLEEWREDMSPSLALRT